VPGPVWMGVEKRKCFAHTGVRTVGRYTVYALPPLFTFKDEVAAQIAVAWGCQNERYTRARARAHTHTHTHTHTHISFWGVFRRVKPRGRVCRQIWVTTEQKKI